jgi:hypothetical protein
MAAAACDVVRRDHGGAGASAPGPCFPSALLLPPSPCFTASILLSSAIWSFCAGAACEEREPAGGGRAQGHRRSAGRADYPARGALTQPSPAHPNRSEARDGGAPSPVFTPRGGSRRTWWVGLYVGVSNARTQTAQTWPRFPSLRAIAARAPVLGARRPAHRGARRGSGALCPTEPLLLLRSCFVERRFVQRRQAHA